MNGQPRLGHVAVTFGERDGYFAFILKAIRNKITRSKILMYCFIRTTSLRSVANRPQITHLSAADIILNLGKFVKFYMVKLLKKRPL